MDRASIIAEMKLIFTDMPYGVNHTLRVLNNADAIMTGEHVGEKTQEIISLAAILHDIGAAAAQQKYNSIEGRFQEIEGPAIARAILVRASVRGEGIDRVCFIVGNHHTPSKIDGLDFQILWEADLLDSLEFGERSRNGEELMLEIQKNFKTATGKNLALQRCGYEQ